MVATMFSRHNQNLQVPALSLQMALTLLDFQQLTKYTDQSQSETWEVD